MKLLFVLFFSVAVSAAAQDVQFKADPAQSTLKWFGYYAFNFGEHNGLVKVGSGNVVVKNNVITAGTLEIDMTTISNLDMTDGGVVIHLKSEDFFDVDKFPKASFVITKVQEIEDSSPGKPNYEIHGNFTMKGLTHPLKIESIIVTQGSEITATGRFKFDRTKWDVRHGSGKFFESIGDDAISDAIGIEFNIKFIKQ